MDIKGAILNLASLRSLYYQIDSFNYSDGFLSGVEGFNLSPLNGFKDEFPGVVKAIQFLDDQIFKHHNLEEDHQFVIHFENDVAEMDCVTFLSIGDIPFFVDIEVKDTNHVEQLDEQFKLRESDSLIQLNLSENYILIGFLNNSFEKAVFKFDKNRYEIDNIETLKELLSNLSNKKINLKLILKDVESLLKIQDVKNKIVNKDFKYYSATKDAIDCIETNIRNNKKIIVVYGDAGCGKTVVALSLLFKYVEVKLLILNKNLYTSLSLYQQYKIGTCFYGTDSFINSLTSDSIAIIDECQRLSLHDIYRIACKARCVVLLGDNNQAFAYGDFLLTEEELKSYLVEHYGFDDDEIRTKRMKKTARYNSRVNKLLSVLHNNSPIVGYANEVKDKVDSGYAVDVTMSEKEFINKTTGLSGTTRFFVPFSNKLSESIQLNNNNYQVAGRDDATFSVAQYYNNYIGNTYHAISFDVDNSFVILKKVGITKRGGKFYFYDKNENPDIIPFDLLQKYNNQIHILFTRGRKSLHILTDDFYVYTYLNFKIQRGIR